MSIIACYSSKGGVGKTAASVNLACASAQRGHRTLLVDLDQQGSAGFYFRVRPPDAHRAKTLLGAERRALEAIRETDDPRLHILPSHFSYRRLEALLERERAGARRGLEGALAELATGYRHVLLDCPPSIGRVAEAIFELADVVLVPLVPTTLSRRTFEQLSEFFADRGHPPERLRPFLSMVDRRKRMHLESVRELRSSEKRLLEAEIPYCAEVEAMGLHRAPVLWFAPRHRSSGAFHLLWLELEGIERGGTDPGRRA